MNKQNRKSEHPSHEATRESLRESFLEAESMLEQSGKSLDLPTETLLPEIKAMKNKMRNCLKEMPRLARYHAVMQLANMSNDQVRFFDVMTANEGFRRMTLFAAMLMLQITLLELQSEEKGEPLPVV